MNDVIGPLSAVTSLESHGLAAATVIGSSGSGDEKMDSGEKHRPAEATSEVPRGVLRLELAAE